LDCILDFLFFLKPVQEFMRIQKIKENKRIIISIEKKLEIGDLVCLEYIIIATDVIITKGTIL